MDRDGLFLLCLFLVLFVGSVVSVLYIENLINNEPPYKIERSGNKVSFALNGFNLLQEWDVVTITMNNKSEIIYLHDKEGYYGYMSVKSPMSEKVHITADVIYVNGTKERIEDGWY
jgi:hypothetical protein